ncbi:hypothetical protein UFOVP1288_53 [uncultured Caudovirales phage]|uniref:Uncharacterized protein n=1 Tax=uncultured Caudovirales phage TaxID=2100421 RepID=A0A6J5RCV2_9CAUD|nr:hypothetical protein UFOVP1195_53 [uncultured Caudovirales phage]CAB4195998.1 hypothetical protein UFOVP1288_53 [uncultured Caudovirales phage]CAB4205107.1 hypothetical protein UFOVP1409_53 [uncultured Caudovirales phage]
MMSSLVSVGDVSVTTTSGRGATPEEITERALNRIIAVSGTAPPVIREQAEAFKDSIRAVLVYYMHEAIRAHNVTLVHRFHDAGYSELVSILDP